MYEGPETFCPAPSGSLSLNRFSFLWFLNHSQCQVGKPVNRHARFLLPVLPESLTVIIVMVVAGGVMVVVPVICREYTQYFMNIIHVQP